MAKDLEYYLAQARRIAEHRDAGVEKEIRKLYKEMLTDLQTSLTTAYGKLGTGDKLSYATLQQIGYQAKFLEEIDAKVNLGSARAVRATKAAVKDSYKLAYEGMVEGVKKASGNNEELWKAFEGFEAATPEQIKAAVENPITGLTLSDRLEKRRKDIIYDIKQTVGVGLMNGERYSTMARRISTTLDGDYKKAIRIVRTETHRVREAGNAEAAVSVDNELQNGTTDMRMVKTWKSMKDERVRPQQRRKTKKGWKTTMGKGADHMKMDGQTVLANEEFDLGQGIKATAPSNSGDAGNDINCRCYVSYEMMTDAEYFAKTGKHFGIDPEKKALKKEKELLDEQTAMQQERDDAQAEMDALNQRQFDNIWKDPVTAADYEKLKDRLDAKRDYFRANGRQDMLDLCDEFETAGIKYMQANGRFTAANMRLDDLADEIKDARLHLMKVRGIDIDAINLDIDNIKGQINALQAQTGKKLSLNTKVKNYDKDHLKQAMKDALGWDDDAANAIGFDLWGEDTVKMFMDSWITWESDKTKFKQTLKKLASQPSYDPAELARLQKLLSDREAELAQIMKRYGLDIDDAFSQERKDAAYWFTGYDAKERADKVLRPDTAELWRNASALERQSAYKYTSGSGSFNRPLRGYEGSWYNYKGVGKVDWDYEGSGDNIKALTDLIDRNPSKFDIWLQRGVESDSGAAGFLGIDEKWLTWSKDDLAKALLGKTVKDEAFTSSAGAKGQGFSGRLILNIFAPKGTKFIYCEPFSRYGDGAGLSWDGKSGQSSFGYEFEVLLQRGTSYKITKIDKSGYTWYIDVDIVGQP